LGKGFSLRDVLGLDYEYRVEQKPWIEESIRARAYWRYDIRALGIRMLTPLGMLLMAFRL